MSEKSGKRSGSTEGIWTKVGVVAGVLSLIVGYLALAGTNHWPPFGAGGTGSVLAGAATPHNTYQPDQQAVLLSDPLTSSSGHWVNESAGTGTCDIRPDGLHAAIDSKNVYHECASKTSAVDFTFEVTFMFGSASGAGIFFRAVGPGSWYNAQFSKDGDALISIGHHSESTNLPDQQLTPPDLAVPHTLAVVAVGDVITFYVDHEKVLTTRNGTYSSGFMGVYAVNGHPGGDAVFRNAVIWGP